MAASGTTIAQSIANLKEYYSSDEVLNSTLLMNNPMFGMMSKDPSFSGEWKPYPITSSSSAGLSTDFGSAQGSVSASVLRKFQVPALPTYAIARVSTIAIKASRNDVGAFEEILKVETDNSMQSAINLMSNYMFRSGTGTLGQINASYGTNGAITFVNLTDAAFFFPGLQLTASSGDGSGTVRAGVGYVQTVDPSGGTMVVAATPGLGQPGTNPSGWAASDYLQIKGTFNNAPMGIAGWLPYTTATRPSSTASAQVNILYGVDRSIDPRSYAGFFYDGSRQSNMDALIDGLSEGYRLGATPKFIITNPVSYRAVVKEMMSKREYVTIEGPTGIGYKAIVIDGDNGPIPLMSDRNCPPNVGFALDDTQIEMISYDKAPGLLVDADGNDYLRLQNADGLELRIGAYWNTGMKKPSSSGAIGFAQ